MKILVCVKQVPDPEASVSISQDRTWICTGGERGFTMNRFDQFAVEEARLIREDLAPETETSIDVISAGPARVRSTLKKAMAMGADRAIHILRETEEYASPFDTASLIAEWVGDKGYDIVLTGVMAEDDMHSMVGQLIAEILGYACATSVIHREITAGKRDIYVEREVESGRRECLSLRLPAVLTVQPGLNSPGYPSLSSVLRAAEQEIVTIDEGSVGPPDERERLTSLSHPETSSKGLFIQGTPEEKARELNKIFHASSLI